MERETSQDIRTNDMDFSQRWNSLLTLGLDETSGGYRRHSWNESHESLVSWFAQQCNSLNLEFSEDSIGNLWGTWSPSDPTETEAVAYGSHLDSVANGGAFDGPLGVVSAFSAIAALQRAGFTPRRPVLVAAFLEEEGARFGVACLGSKLATGQFDAAAATELEDKDGVTLAQAMRTSGRKPDNLGTDRLPPLRSYVELHIEQGRQLAPAGAALGLGTHIWPHGRWRIVVNGVADHAGTTELRNRDDAFLKFAEFAIEMRKRAEEIPCLTTFGEVKVFPGSANAIPEKVVATIDIRAAEQDPIDQLLSAAKAHLDSIHGHLETISLAERMDFSPSLTAELSEISDDMGTRAPLIGTGAGHDAGILAQAGIESAMIFVRNPEGSSHTPAEAADLSDCVEGVKLLREVIRRQSSH